MKKTVLQGIITILLFLGTWFVLTQIDWVKVFKIQKITNTTEQKLGELFWDVFKKTEKESKNTHVLNAIDSIVTHICSTNKIDRKKIKIHVLNKDEINAFALPGGHLIVYSGLIMNVDNQQELTGVICHEIAHIELNHVMKKLVKEIGLSVLISMTTNGGPEVIKETAKMLSSSAFDRNLEKEADIKAVDYLIKAKVNPEPFANFLYKLSQGHEGTKYLTWISTHPDSKERAAYITEHNKNRSEDYRAILSKNTWDKLKEELKD
ncbi:peptidase M48 Ste24p [Pseudopedobacter saltans DSM 12145]|uniref:Peptidase M48 Ste24p n=1 Tax=Pseudopedobacter saltans (strain ATCC 51119 / DSM 12145 / JCM 21818 / CCUG 39354 / LMG 10337 / NBRC 100064 / NCIMB 13643) TaxID=762903 RepID=F0SEC5_PSESL|nr:M48 family metallopeptidase [Pseudopedobacter saltans]ADY54047.1 peptidase M48 Ste24p [Pseudopedobacter saltans DSM 12145]